MNQAIVQLARRNIRSQYAGSSLGLVWALIEPLILASAFIFLRRSGIITVGEISLPYPVYAVCGVLVWQTCCDGITGSMNSISSMRSVLKTARIGTIDVIGSTLLSLSFFHVFRLIIAVCTAIVFGIHDPMGLVLFVALSFVSLFFGMTIGILVAPFAEIYTDIKIFVAASLRPLLFVSGVIIPIPSTFSFLHVLNPIAVSISAARNGLVDLDNVDFALLAVWGGVMLLLFCFSFSVFRRALRVVL